MTKKILKITSLVLLSVSLILAIITLVNYYNYVDTLQTLTSSELTMIEKFELQDARENYLFKTLKIMLWSSYVSIATIVTCITTAVVARKKTEPKKIR